MRLYVDLDLRQITAGLGINSPMPALYFKRGDAEDLIIQFTRAGIVVDPDPDTVFFCVKAVGTYDGDPLVLHTSFTKSGTGTTALWTGTPDFGTTDINTLLGVGGGTDVASVTLNAEVGFTTDGRDTTARTISCVVENDLYRGTETAPPAYPRSGNVNLYPTIVGLTGGGATKLDGLPTVGVAAGVVAQVVVSGELQSWKLAASAASENGYSLVRPDDYHATTNIKLWERVRPDSLWLTVAVEPLGMATYASDRTYVHTDNNIAPNGVPAADTSRVSVVNLSPTSITLETNADTLTIASGAVAVFDVNVDGGSGDATFTLTDTWSIDGRFLSGVPATATSAGTAGQTAFDATHAYFCTAANTWKRVAIATW